MYPPFDVTFIGTLADGATTVEQTFTLDGTFGPQTFFFDDDFTDLLSVSWKQQGNIHTASSQWYQFDNIRLDEGRQAAVPEPATMLLFASGLLGLAGAYKKRKS